MYKQLDRKLLQIGDNVRRYRQVQEWHLEELLLMQMERNGV